MIVDSARPQLTSVRLRDACGWVSCIVMLGGYPQARYRNKQSGCRRSDPFLVLADYASYVECQGRVSAAWQDADAWTRMSILDTARSGKFSSDRAIAEYCDEIWNVRPVTVKVER